MSESAPRLQPHLAEVVGDTLYVHELETRDSVTVEVVKAAVAAGHDPLAVVETLLTTGARVQQMAGTDEDVRLLKQAVESTQGSMGMELRNLKEQSGQAIEQLTKSSEQSIKQLTDPSGSLQQNLGRILEEFSANIDKSLTGEDAPVRAMIQRQLGEVRELLTRSVTSSLSDQRTEMAKLLDPTDPTSPLRALVIQLNGVESVLKQVQADVTKQEIEEEALSGTTFGGLSYEDVAAAALLKAASRIGDTCEPTGNKQGLVKNRKSGDAVSSFIGPSGETIRIVMEAKFEKLDTKKWETEAANSRRNRGAVGFLGMCKRLEDMPGGQRLWVKDMKTMVLAFDPEVDDQALLDSVYQLLKLSVLTRVGQVDDNAVAAVAQRLSNTVEKLQRFDEAGRQVSAIENSARKLKELHLEIREGIEEEVRAAQAALKRASEEVPEDLQDDLGEDEADEATEE